MLSDFVFRVKTPNGFVTSVTVRAISITVGRDLAGAYGQVLGLVESRYVQ